MAKNSFHTKNTQMCCVYIGGGDLESVTDAADIDRESFSRPVPQGASSIKYWPPVGSKDGLLKVGNFILHWVVAQITSVSRVFTEKKKGETKPLTTAF